jgi:NAD(P)H-dependent FMN reductase
MRIAIISGSARTNNNTIRVAKAIQRVLSSSHQVTIIDFIHYDIPLMAQGGMNAAALTPFQSGLIQAIDEAHVVVMISPEYNIMSYIIKYLSSEKQYFA